MWISVRLLGTMRNCSKISCFPIWFKGLLPHPISYSVTLSAFETVHSALILVDTGKESACNVGTWVRSLGWEDPLEEGMATHSSILAWRISMDRGAWWTTVHGVAKSRTRLSD